MMYSIEQVKKANEEYEKESERLNLLYKEVKDINSNIDLEEIKEKLNYAEVKELYELLTGIRSSETGEKLKKILENKKAEEYPQINDVHYYPIINNINFLNREDKIELDRLLKDSYANRIKSRELRDLDEKTINFLINNGLIEKLYIFHCDCGGLECGDEIITQEQFDKLKDYWIKLIDDKTTDEEDEYMNYGCLQIGCWNDDLVEVCCLEDFNENLRRVEYRVKVRPDTTLDNI